MKKIIYQILPAFFLVCFFANISVFAQSDDDEKMIKITIVTNDDQVIVKKKRINTGELPTDFEEFRDLDSDDIKSIDVEIVENSYSKKECAPRSGRSNDLFLYKNGNFDANKDEIVELRERMRNQRRSWDMNFGESKPLLGVYISDDSVEKGVKLSSVIRGKGAEVAGLEKGDIITKVAGNRIDNANDIGRAIKEMKPGDEVKVVFIRNGQKMSEKVELSAGRTRFKHKSKRDPCKVFIGVYTNSTGGEGVKVQSIIDGTPASEMDLQKGDIILEFDRVAVNSQSQLLRERNENQPGDYFKLTILREGKKRTVRGQFKSCEDENEDEIENRNNPQIRRNLSPSLNVEAFETFPNPTFGPINIEFKGAQVPTIIRVTDVTGKVVFEEVISNFDGVYQRRVNITNARAGNLSVSVIQNNRATTKNVILLNRV